jgi:hypothetical protein
MASKPEDLRERTKRFALRVIRLFRALPKGGDAQVIGKELLRSGTEWRQIIGLPAGHDPGRSLQREYPIT